MDWKGQGRVCLKSLAQKDNGIVLCNSCHYHYDAPQCNWILLPTDMDYFIAEEDRDFQRRKREIQSSGRLLDRLPPTAAKYFQHQLEDALVSSNDIGGTYACWVLRDFQAASGQVFPVGQSAIRNWHGDPTAAICKSLLTPGLKLFDAPDELESLGKAYANHDRELRRLQGQAETGGESTPNNRDGGHGAEKKQHRPEGSKDRQPSQGSSSKLRRSARHQSKDYGATQHKIQKPLVELATSRKPKPRLQRVMYSLPRPTSCIKIERPPPLFEWGPHCSAQDVIDLANFFNVKVGTESGS